MTEWKHIPGFPGYDASSTGEIRSLPRRIGGRLFQGKVLKPWVISKTGYLQVTVSKRKRVSVHRLVALAFYGTPMAGLVVNHKNGIRSDNRVSNLEWVSQSDNRRHAFRELKAKKSCEGKFSSDHPTSMAVISRCPATGVEKYYASAMDAVRKGFRSCCISRCCHGQSRTHKGLEWRFATLGAERGVQWSNEERKAA